MNLCTNASRASACMYQTTPCKYYLRTLAGPMGSKNDPLGDPRVKLHNGHRSGSI